MTSTLKILLIEDDSNLSIPLSARLELEDYQVQVAEDGPGGLKLLQNDDFDLAVVDWELPDLSGVELISAYRNGGGNKPIIMLTGKADIDSRAEGLDCGADDYLPKPFIAAELIARLKSILRRPQQILPDKIKIDNFEIDLRSRQLRIEGQTVKITQTEYAVLEFLLANPNKMFNSNMLLASVWSAQATAGEEAVRACIKRLRKKITDSNGICVLETTASGYTIKYQP